MKKVKKNMLKQLCTYHKIFNKNLDNIEDCLCFLYAYSIHKSNIKNKKMSKNIDDCFIEWKNNLNNLNKLKNIKDNT